MGLNDRHISADKMVSFSEGEEVRVGDPEWAALNPQVEMVVEIYSDLKILGMMYCATYSFSETLAKSRIQGRVFPIFKWH